MRKVRTDGHASACSRTQIPREIWPAKGEARKPRPSIHLPQGAYPERIHTAGAGCHSSARLPGPPLLPGMMHTSWRLFKRVPKQTPADTPRPFPRGCKRRRGSQTVAAPSVAVGRFQDGTTPARGGTSCRSGRQAAMSACSLAVERGGGRAARLMSPARHWIRPSVSGAINGQTSFK